jgi:hypothetical protein
VELEADARCERLPRGTLGLRRRLGTAASAQREEIEVVVTGNDEEPSLVLPPRKGRLDELPADAVVGDVAGDHHGVDVALLDGLDRA